MHSAVTFAYYVEVSSTYTKGSRQALEGIPAVQLTGIVKANLPCDDVQPMLFGSVEADISVGEFELRNALAELKYMCRTCGFNVYIRVAELPIGKVKLLDIHVNVTGQRTTGCNTTGEMGPWVFSGEVFGQIASNNYDANGVQEGEKAQALTAYFLFDTWRNTWEAALRFDLKTDMLDLWLMGRVANPCLDDTKPVKIKGEFTLTSKMVKMEASLHGRYWCQTHSALRLNVEAVVDSLDIGEGAIPIFSLENATFNYSVLGGLPANTSLSLVPSEGDVGGTIKLNTPRDAAFTLSTEAHLHTLFKYQPGSGMSFHDVVVDAYLGMNISGSFDLPDNLPMIQVDLAGRFAPASFEAYTAEANIVIRIPTKKDEAWTVSELALFAHVELWGAHIPYSLRDYKVMKFAAGVREAQNLFGRVPEPIICTFEQFPERCCSFSDLP